MSELDNPAEELNDDIRSAIEESMAEQPSQDTQPAAKEEPLSEAQATRQRDTQGRFIAQAAEKLNEAPTPEVQPEDGPVRLTVEKPPSSWTPAARELWKDLPDAAKSEIIRREQDSANRAHRMQEMVAPAENMFNSLKDVFMDAQQGGYDAVQQIRGAMDIERGLRSGDMPSRFQVLLAVADQYQIPLRQIINESVGQQVLQSPNQTEQAQIPPQIMQEIAEIKAWRSEQEYRTVANEVEGWGSNKEFFSDVRALMAELVERQMVRNIDDAYDMACRMHPEVFKVMMQRGSQPVQNASVMERQKAAAGVSKVSTGRSVPSKETPDEEKSIEDIVRESMYASNGRV